MQVDTDKIESILQRLTRIETLLENNNNDALEKRVDKLESNATWLWRSIATLIISAIGVLIFK